MPDRPQPPILRTGTRSPASTGEGSSPHKARSVAIFLPSLAGGGAERVLHLLAESLAELPDTKVDLLLAKRAGAFLDSVSSAITIVELGGGRVLKAILPLRRYLLSERPDVVLSALPHVNFAAICACYLAGRPSRLVLSEHNQISVGAPDAELTVSTWMLGLLRPLYRLADEIVAVSDGVARELYRHARLRADKVTVIYNPIVSPELLAAANRPIDHPWFSDGQPPVVLGVGRLTRQKNFAGLIEAFSKVRNAREAKLVILGDGEQRRNLERLIQDLGLDKDVSMPGFAANPYAYMKKAAVFALSSDWEGLPTVLVEAMACGTRIVATDCPSGPAEILLSGAFGRLVPAGDAPALAQGILQALDAPRDSERTQARALDFSVGRAVQSYVRILFGENPRPA